MTEGVPGGSIGDLSFLVRACGALALAMAVLVGGSATASVRPDAQAPTAAWHGEIEWEYRSVPDYAGARTVEQARVTPLATSRVVFLHDPETRTDVWDVYATWHASVDERHEWTVNGSPPRRCSWMIRGEGSGDALPVRISIHRPTQTYTVEIRPGYSGFGDSGFQAAETQSCSPERNGTTPRPIWAGRRSDRLPLPQSWSRSKRLTGSVVRDSAWLHMPGKTATLKWDLTLVTPPATRDTVAPSLTEISVTPKGPVAIRFRVSEAATVKGQLTLLSRCTPAGCGGRARVVRTLAPRTVAAGPVFLRIGSVAPGYYRLRVVLTDKAGNRRVLVRDLWR